MIDDARDGALSQEGSEPGGHGGFATGEGRDRERGCGASVGSGGRIAGAILVRPLTARFLRLALALPLFFLLAACAMIDPLTRDICTAVIPALEPGEARPTLVAADPDPARPDNIRLVYRVITPLGYTDQHTIVCAFGPDPATGDRRALLGLRTDSGELGEARFYMLKRFWLGDPKTFGEALARVDIAETARPHGMISLDRDAGLLLQHLLDAASPSALYCLLALACSLIYGLVGRINFAFGDIATIGAYGALVGALLVEAAGIEAVAPLIGMALLTAVVITAAWGGVLGRVVFAPLAFRTAQPLLVATVGLSIALQEFVARAQGSRERFLAPILNQPRLVADGGFPVSVTPMRVLVVTLTLSLVVVVLAIFPRSRFGRDWRATADDARMARLLGIDPGRVLVVTFMLASALAAVAGAILTLAYGGTSFHMGTMLGLKAVVAAVVGGIGSLPGAALGGLLVGLGETAWSAWFGIEWRDTAVLSMLVIFLLFRPTGLLGSPEALEERDPQS